MKVALRYGRDGLVIDLPDTLDVQVIGKPAVPVLADPAAAVQDALARPVSAPPLAELASGSASACILICDITRPVPNGLFLQPMIRQLMAAGMAAERITVLVATGLHRPNLGPELDELIGDPWVLETVRVENHDARAAGAHLDLGLTTGGVPVRLDRRFIEADLKIATGLVEPHFMAGYSGGRKVIAPGIAHESTIRTFHSARFMEDPAAVQCNLDGNPLHAAQLEIVGMLAGHPLVAGSGTVYALNTVLDDARHLALVNFGEVIASHLAAVEFAARVSTVPVPRRFRTLVTSAAGYPLDSTYYQTVKGMVTPMDILAPDADLIVAASCSEGLGSDAFRHAQRQLETLGTEAFLGTLLEKDYADVDEWQTEMQLKPMRVANVHLYTTGLDAADRALTCVSQADSVERAVRASVERTGERSVAVIPEGPYVIPRYVPDAPPPAGA